MSIPRYLRRLVTGRRWPSLARALTPIRDLSCLKIALGWDRAPILMDDHIHEYLYPEDANHRRLHDAEVVAAACRNAADGHIVEIGTSLGHMTAIMAMNASGSTIHTINIPPEEIAEGGVLTTHAPDRDQIGSYYRTKGLVNIHQIFANTATWIPDIPEISVAFIDGCHDERFVINDTKKILQCCAKGSVILWHDFHPGLADRFPWLSQVVGAVDLLIQDGLIEGPIFHVQDSWVGIYRLP